MKKIKAKIAVLNKKNSVEILDVFFKEPKSKQALVKIYYSGICASQLMEFKGLRGKDNWLPHMFGHEGAGEIVKLGKNIKNLKVGDKVILSWLKRTDKNISGYIKNNSKIINYGPVTTFGNYSLISENRIYKLPKQIPIEDAAMYGCAIPTGMGIVTNEAKPKKIDKCAVVGLGGVGIFSLIALKAIGIKQIVGLDINQKKIGLIKKLGFKNILNLKNKDCFKKILKITNNKKFDFVFESSGHSSSIEESFELLNTTKGRLYFSSHPKNQDFIKIKPHELISGKKIFGSWGGKSNLDKNLLTFYKLIKKTNIKLKDLYQIFKLSDLKIIMNNYSKLDKPRAIIKMEHK